MEEGAGLGSGGRVSERRQERVALSARTAAVSSFPGEAVFVRTVSVTEESKSKLV